MAGGKSSSNASRLRKRVEAESAPSSSPSPSLKRARDGSAFTKCEVCSKDVAVALISFHDCSLDAKIKMNLEAQVVEMSAEAKKKPAAERKKTNPTEPKAKRAKNPKAKNPNAKKRPRTAFFVFMDDFRKSFKEANPDCKSVATVAKEGGEKWKSMSDEEKKVYIDRAAELKAEYVKDLESNDAEDEQDGDDSAEKEVKEETDDSSEEVEEEADDSSEKEVKEIADDSSEKEVKDSVVDDE